MLEKLSAQITEKLKSKEIISTSNEEVCAYGLRQIFSTLINVGTMLLIGMFMQMPVEAILFTIGYIPIRIYAGGYHASTPQRCWAFSAVMLWLALCIVKYIPIGNWCISLILSLISGIVILLLSPVEDQNKMLDEAEHHVYHIRTILVFLIEAITVVGLWLLQFQKAALTIEIAWCAVAAMLLLGKAKKLFQSLCS